MSILNLSMGNPYSGMSREEFLSLLDSMGITWESGDGKIVFEETKDMPQMVHESEAAH